MVTVPGRDGELIMDKGRYETVVRKFPCRLLIPNNGDLEAHISQMHQWLVDEEGLHDLLLDPEPDFVYHARIDNGVTTTQILSHLGKVVIHFRLHPIKYLATGLREVPVTPGTNLSHPFGVNAQPIIRIVGGGNMTLNIGGRPLVLQGIAGGCLIDSQTQTITSLEGRITLFDRMYSPFPVLRPGNNVITFPNHIQVFITPRWGALV